METKYYAKNGAMFDNKKAQIYGKHLSKLTKKNKDIITGEIIVNDAKAKNSPLHDYFEWDDSIAANNFRVEQARELVRSIRIEVPVSESKETVFVRAFHNVNKKNNGDRTRGYITFENIRKDKELYDEFVLKKYLAEIKRVNNEYKIYKELEPLTLAIDEVLGSQAELMGVV